MNNNNTQFVNIMAASRAMYVSSKMSQKDMQQQIHGDSAEDSDDHSSEEDMREESDELNTGEEGSAEENSNLSEEDNEDEDKLDTGEEGSAEENSHLSEEDEEDEDASDEEMDSLAGDAEVGDWMEVDEEDSDPNTSSSDESNDDSQVGRTEETGYGDPKLHGNAGWADAMAKILRTSKPIGKKSIVLAKAKKLSQVVAAGKSEEKKEDDYGFEIDGKAPEENDVKPKVEDVDVKPDITDSKFKIKRRDLLAEGKVKPSFLSRERERALNKIATKGVVQLFNAVRDQQKDISRKVKLAHGSVRKEDKIIKSVDKQSFLDSLMGNARSERIEDHIHTKPEEDVKMERSENPTTWNVLRDNFLTGSNMKDWDKCGEIKLEDEDEVELN